MSIEFACPHCGNRTLVADQFVGQTGPCAKCGQMVTVPPPGAAVAGVPAAAGAGSMMAPPAKKGSAMVWVLVIGGALLLCCGGGGGVGGYFIYDMTITAQNHARARNQLAMITYSMQNYNDMHNKLPAHASYDADGKPLLSWRVHLLPALGHDYLYQQFHLDEPWDSPHNKQLLDQMPIQYQSPEGNLAPGMTCFLVAVSGYDAQGACTLFPKPRGPGELNSAGVGIMSFGNVTDGTSNTIAVIRVPPEMAVEWTRPSDFDLDTGNLESLFGDDGGFAACMLDGSTHTIRNTMDRLTLRYLFLCNDGNAAYVY